MKTALALASAAMCCAFAAFLSAEAIDLDVTTQDVERALTIARGLDRDRTRFHAPYILSLNTATVDSVEVVSEFRRYVLTAEDRARKGDRMFGFSSALAQQALGPWKGRLAIVARLRFHPQNTYVAIPPVEIVLEGNERALIGVLKEPVLSLPSGQPGERIPILGTVAEAVFEAVAVGQGVREFIVRLEGRDIARVKFDLSTLE